jgi:hypothetical protein
LADTSMAARAEAILRGDPRALAVEAEAAAFTAVEAAVTVKAN